MEIAEEDSRLTGLCFIHLRPELKPALPYLCPKRRNLFTMNDKTTSIISIVNERIHFYLASLDMRPLHLAHKTGIHNETIYRCLNGKRKWNLGHIELIAPALGVTVGDLFQETIMVPRAGGD
ncbi:MAG: helix-turn-helix domain-containing protein [Proteobacteria bacterium]|nr:helix-turn-helix domain-containing protein [Pseudomonadota bacterium]MBU4353996.1 helix-turn-helix domain-containing protein [Pseudomonadota bacterium]MBU4449530.1 helix-turn-helix domain-containing protein [Pseudomonadota bacterium]